MRHLDRVVDAIANRTAAQDVFEALLNGLREAAPRGALYLVRPEGISGWSCYGYPGDTTSAQRAFACPPGEGWLGRLATAAPDHVVSIEGHGGPPTTESSATAETMAVVVRIKHKTVALVVCQRAGGEEPWCPSTLATLASVARLRLELSLAERRVAGSPRVAAEPRSLALTDDAALCPRPEPTATPDPAPQVSAARRFARLVATDIRLYNEEAVVLGRRHGDLVERLRDSLDRGRLSFLERHADLGDEGLAMLIDAYVEVLGAGEAHLFAALDPSR